MGKYRNFYLSNENLAYLKKRAIKEHVELGTLLSQIIRKMREIEPAPDEHIGEKPAPVPAGGG